MLTYKLHMIRHGITAGNLEGKYIGRTDLPLCPQGITAIQEMMDEYEYPRVGKVYTSPLLRCRQTAELLYPDRQMVVVENLREADMGDFEGKSMEELLKNPQFTGWLQNNLENPPPGGEHPEDFLQRVVHGLEQIFYDMMEDKIHEAAVITHGGVIVTLLSSLGFPRLPYTEWTIDNLQGYTLLMTPELWLRDHIFEVYARIPQSIEQQHSQWLMERYGGLEQDNWEEEDDIDE